MIQYYFDGPEVEIKIKPHGNSKSATPFFRTSESAKKRHKELAATNMPKEAVYQATIMQGGEIEAKGMSSLPRNRQQIANYRRVEKKRDDNVLYSVMLECKLAQGTQEAFVRDVKAAPDPQCVLFFDWQISDMERFLTRSSEHCGILTIDPTYNLGQFYVTPTTYPHLMLEDITTQKNPSLLGPVLIHQRMDFSTFNYFSSTLVGFSKRLRNLSAFGTDGQEALIDAFSHCFPNAVQLRCFIHFKRNVSEKLKEYGIPTGVAEEFLSNIFGKRSGSTYNEGLVDCSSEKDFSEKLEKCMAVWNAREAPFAPASGPRFFNYFRRYKSDIVCHSMRADLRESVGLGCPPKIFTTNPSESINAMMKRKVNYKESEWPQFNEAVKELVKQQREEITRALSGRGQYRLIQEFSHFSVSPSKWVKMRPEQRREVVAQFDKATMKSKRSLSGSKCASTSIIAELPSENKLCVSAEESGITKLTLTTLQHMWQKAEDLMNSDNAITPAPGNDKMAKMVLSYSSPIPHMVVKGQKGQYRCDSNCLNWTSSAICSHTLAVAQVHNDLVSFLQWYNTSSNMPNITSLAMSGLPSGRGRKGGIAKRTRDRQEKKTPELSIPRPVFQPESSSASSSATVPTGTQCSATAPTSPFQSSPSQPTNVFQSSVVGQINLPSQLNHGSTVISTSQNASQSVCSIQPNTNPFYVRCIRGNIRMCQGCRSSLRSQNGSVPAPPFDMAIARAERRSFRDKNGELVTPHQEQTCHYHFCLDCVRVVEPNFIPAALQVPKDIVPSLNVIHREYLRLVFGVTLQ